MDREARLPRGAARPGTARPQPAPPEPRGGELLRLQRHAGNRAVTSLLARRVVGTDPETRLVRLSVGVELTTKLAQAAWTLTAKGPLDEAGVEMLRQIALEHAYHTIDDSERLFIAALLDAGNAAKLHEAFPRGFSEEGSTIEFSGASITPANRRIVQDSGRGTRPEPGDLDKRLGKDALDADMLAMGGDGFRYTVMRAIKLADQAGVDHVALYFAMLNGASDSTPGDRALAGVAYALARREGMPIAKEILGGRLHVDEVSKLMFDPVGADVHAFYNAEAGGGLKGDTLYLPSDFDVDNLAQLGTVVHELQHASDDAGVASPVLRSRVTAEEAAYERQSRFLMVELEKLTGQAREDAELQVAKRVGPTQIYLMVVAALESTDDDQFAERSAIVTEVNGRTHDADPSAALEPGELRRALAGTKEESRDKARAGINRDIKRDKRPSTVRFRGLRGESELDDAPAPKRTLARDPDPDDPNTLGKRVEAEQVAGEAATDAAVKALAAKAKGATDGAGTRELLLKLVAVYVPESRAKIVDAGFDAKVKGFQLSGGKDRWKIVAGDDVVARAADGKVAEVAEELRGAVAPVAEVELSAGRRAVVWVGRERVRIASMKQRAEVARIFKDVKQKYGIMFDSIAARRAAREYYGVGGNATKEQLRRTDAAPWEFEEIQALERAMAHFGPILGDARRRSSRASAKQEIVDVGKLNVAPDDDPTKTTGRSEGERFKDTQTAVLYPPDEEVAASDPKYFDRNAVHELAHGLLEHELDAFMKATGYWSKKLVRSGKRGAEAPPDAYADTNAAEDLAQSVAYYFTDPERLKNGNGKVDPGTPGNKCPKRFAFIRGVVGGWTAKR